MKHSTSALPIHDGGRSGLHCWDCSTPSGERHELSCPEVSLAQMQAEFARQREELARWDRHDRRMSLVRRWVLMVALMLAVALLWGWTR